MVATQVVTYTLSKGKVVAPVDLADPVMSGRRDILFFREEGVKMTICSGREMKKEEDAVMEGMAARKTATGS